MEFVKRCVIAVIRRLIWGIFFLFPIDKNKIVVCNYSGKGYGDNPKYFIDELLKRDRKFKIVWLLKDKKDEKTLPSSIKTCRFGSFANVYHLMTAKVWIDNSRKPFMFKKRKQIYLQLWHGFSLKGIEKDVEEHLSPYYVRQAKKDSKYTNLIVSDSAFMTGIYKRAFWYNGKIGEWGAPRSDVLHKGQIDGVRSKVLRHFNIDEDTKIVLYAPTFRVDLSLNSYSIDYDMLINTCERKFGGNFIVFVRLHPNISSKAGLMSIYNDKVINTSLYNDMQELLATADVVISDYSSLMIDFILTQRPCFRFCTDIDSYEKDRGLYFKPQELPFSLAKDNAELEKNILAFEENEYLIHINEFLNKAGLIRDGNASKKCVDWLLAELR